MAFSCTRISPLSHPTVTAWHWRGNSIHAWLENRPRARAATEPLGSPWHADRALFPELETARAAF